MIFLEWLLKRIPRPLSWIKQVLGMGNQRVHALVLMMSCATLCISVLILTFGPFFSKSVYGEYVAAVTALGALGGWAYAQGKSKEKQDGQKTTDS